MPIVGHIERQVTLAVGASRSPSAQLIYRCLILNY